MEFTRHASLLFFGTVVLAACHQASGDGVADDSTATDGAIATSSASPTPALTRTPATASASQTTSVTPPPGYTDGSGINEGYPDLTPAKLTPEAERGETGARNVLVAFARAIEMREYDQAWRMMSPSEQRKRSRTRFNALFEGLRDITVAVPGGSMEGATGSSYYTSQATITATGANGRPIRLEGPLVLRRVNDVPGSSAAARRWRVESADLS